MHKYPQALFVFAKFLQIDYFTRTLRRVFSLHQSPIWAIAAGPGYCVTASADKAIKWEAPRIHRLARNTKPRFVETDLQGFSHAASAKQQLGQRYTLSKRSKGVGEANECLLSGCGL